MNMGLGMQFNAGEWILDWVKWLLAGVFCCVVLSFWLKLIC